MRPAVFLDRDGTLIEDVGYLDRVERLTVFPWTVEALRVLKRGGFALVVVTNQSGIAQAMIEEPFVKSAHALLAERFAAAGAAVDGIYYCPHHPSAALVEYRVDCECRKPRPGMVMQAARDLDLDLPRSFAVGDKWLDVGLAQSFGGRGLLVRTGYGATEERRPRPDITPAAVVNNVLEAASWILRHGR